MRTMQQAMATDWAPEHADNNQGARMRRVLSIEEMRARLGVTPPMARREAPPERTRPRIVWRREEAMA